VNLWACASVGGSIVFMLFLCRLDATPPDKAASLAILSGLLTLSLWIPKREGG
jgi:hypothetical protein